MGNIIPDYVREYNSNPQGAPVHQFVPTYDPNYGFDGKRKELSKTDAIVIFLLISIIPLNESDV